MSDRIIPAWSEPDGMPYRPSNGTEGCFFFDGLCSNCAFDKAMNGTKDEDDCGPEDLCELIARSMAFDVQDADYPKEWIWKDGEPTCTKYWPMDGEPKRERCAHTPDMFPREIDAVQQGEVKARLQASAAVTKARLKAKRVQP